MPIILGWLLQNAKAIEFEKIVFMDAPSNLDLIDSDVYLLTHSELRQNWHHSVSKLGRAEMEQIRQWKPQTVGEIIFYFWD